MRTRSQKNTNKTRDMSKESVNVECVVPNIVEQVPKDQSMTIKAEDDQDEVVVSEEIEEIEITTEEIDDDDDIQEPNDVELKQVEITTSKPFVLVVQVPEFIKLAQIWLQKGWLPGQDLQTINQLMDSTLVWLTSYVYEERKPTISTSTYLPISLILLSDVYEHLLLATDKDFYETTIVPKRFGAGVYTEQESWTFLIQWLDGILTMTGFLLDEDQTGIAYHRFVEWWHNQDKTFDNVSIGCFPNSAWVIHCFVEHFVSSVLVHESVRLVHLDSCWRSKLKRSKQKHVIVSDNEQDEPLALDSEVIVTTSKPTKATTVERVKKNVGTTSIRNKPVYQFIDSSDEE